MIVDTSWFDPCPILATKKKQKKMDLLVVVRDSDKMWRRKSWSSKPLQFFFKTNHTSISRGAPPCFVRCVVQ
jgi:hypothetical protein